MLVPKKYTVAEAMERRRISKKLGEEHAELTAQALILVDVKNLLHEHLSPIAKKLLSEFQLQKSNQATETFKELLESLQIESEIVRVVYPEHISSPINPLDADDPSRIQSPYSIPEYGFSNSPLD